MTAAVDVDKLVDALGLDDAQKQRIQNVLSKSGGFRQMLGDILAVKKDVDLQKNAVMSFLDAAEQFLEQAAQFARSQGVDEAQLQEVMVASNAERTGRAQDAFVQARQFRRMGGDVVAGRSGDGVTRYEAAQKNAEFEQNYRTQFLEKMLALAISLFGSENEAKKALAYFDTGVRESLFQAVASGGADRIQPAIKAAADGIVQKALSETDPSKKIAERNPLMLRFRVDQLCSLLCIGALNVTAKETADLELHEAMLAAIMKRAPEEAVMDQIGADYKKLTTLGDHLGVKARLSNGKTVRFYMENGQENEIPAAISTACDAADPKHARIIDVDSIPDGVMLAAIGQLNNNEILRTKLADVPAGLGTVGADIVIRGAAGTTTDFTAESIGGVTLDTAQRQKVADEIKRTPMKYLDRGFKISVG